MNKLMILLLLSFISVQGMAKVSISLDREIVTMKKEPVLDNGSTNPPVKPQPGNGGGDAPRK